MQLKQLENFCSQTLSIDQFQDYCPNGLQIEGASNISKIITGVSACEALIDRAIESKAQAILVHHGYFWKGEASPIVGIKARKIKKLIQNEISLLAYHLPLDAHTEIGNNIELAKRLGITHKGGFYPHNGINIGFHGELEKEAKISTLSQLIENKLKRKPLVLSADDRPIKKIAWCTGGAQNAFEQAIALGVDVYISGEVSENTYHLAIESGVHYIAAGHHATERYGIQALGKLINDGFKVEVEFIDIDNPV